MWKLISHAETITKYKNTFDGPKHVFKMVCCQKWGVVMVVVTIIRYSVQQDSFVKIVEACQDRNCSSDKWQSKLESSNWMSHVKDVLSAACLVSQCVDR